jgi:hypothetical protein
MTHGSFLALDREQQRQSVVVAGGVVEVAMKSGILVVDGPVEWIARVRAEYLDMPGLSLTKSQMCRLWWFDAQTCETVVQALVASGFLHRRANQTYVRADSHA